MHRVYSQYWYEYFSLSSFGRVHSQSLGVALYAASPRRLRSSATWGLSASIAHAEQPSMIEISRTLMRITLDLPDYDPNKGLQYKWVGGSCINLIVDDDGVTIQGNKEGLRSLANHLLTLANEEVPLTSHIHLDGDNGLEDGSASLLITKELDRSA